MTIESYKNIPDEQRYSGEFSAATIESHLKLSRTGFLVRLWSGVKKSAVRHIGSFLCACAVLYGLASGYDAGLEQIQPLLRFLFAMWTTSFICASLVRVVAYPTRRSAKEDLLLIRSTYLEHAPDHPLKA
ncbi:hypothetical protein [Marinobacter sp. ELB17]|uniref:hypothetical protein n=1 Tax=Marinobacter sp. ELB17 TaxID=270374 RepID=UPI0012F51F60|nr:hypothetical protein [Marinobacter sp. ELB17]